MFQESEFRLPVEGGEKLKKNEFRIGLISDTHNIENPEELIRGLKNKQLDMVFHTGDIAAGPITNRLTQEAKRILAIKSGLSKEELSEEEEEEYQNITSSEDFKKFLERGNHPARAYRKCKMLRDPHLSEQDLLLEQEEIKKIIASLKELNLPVKHVLGNVDLADEERTDFVLKQEAVSEIKTMSKPEFVNLGEKSCVIVWPSQKIDPKHKEEINKMFLAKADELAREAKDKKHIIVIGHEHLLKGPKKYGELAKEQGFGRVRLPRLQPAPVQGALIHLLENLSPGAEIVYIHGHMHDPREVMLAGMPYLKESRGKISFGIGMPGTKRYKNIDIIYLPQGKTAVLKVGHRGIEMEE